jgi:hypothetical protein
MLARAQVASAGVHRAGSRVMAAWPKSLGANTQPRRTGQRSAWAGPTRSSAGAGQASGELDIRAGGAYTNAVDFLDGVSWSGVAVSALAVLLIGVSKAGFGGGLGMLSTPLCVLAFGPRDAIGVLLPLLCAGDAFSLRPYWGKWEARNVKYLLPGVVAGVIIGVQLIGRFSARQLNIAIGILAVVVVVFQMAKERITRAEGVFTPNHRLGVPFGIGAGITSTFAHGAGPVVTMFLVPQRLPKEIFVGTMVLLFTWINWIKLPFFVGTGLITAHTVGLSLLFLPLVPLGVWLGVWLNRRFSEAAFLGIVYALTFLTGLQLIAGFDLAGWWRRLAS